jgi:hypothetical protein
VSRVYSPPIHYVTSSCSTLPSRSLQLSGRFPHQNLYAFFVSLSRHNVTSNISTVLQTPTTLINDIYYYYYYFMALQPFVGPCPLFQFLDPIYTVGRTPWTGDQPVARPLRTQDNTNTEYKHTRTSMPQAGLEPTIPVSEREKTVNASERTATVTGWQSLWVRKTYEILLTWVRHFIFLESDGFSVHSSQIVSQNATESDFSRTKYVTLSGGEFEI